MNENIFEWPVERHKYLRRTNLEQVLANVQPSNLTRIVNFYYYHKLCRLILSLNATCTQELPYIILWKPKAKRLFSLTPFPMSLLHYYNLYKITYIKSVQNIIVAHFTIANDNLYRTCQPACKHPSGIPRCWSGYFPREASFAFPHYDSA